ncbi:MAG: glutamate racemase [Bacillota bacterium]|nr:glutamate racemase [Bacillota bacterium]
MEKKHRPIGFLDSGVGGISVLREAIKLLPNENYIYYGDSKNAPYGTKSVEEVKKLTISVVDILLAKGAKAVVVACNTATSAAITELRKSYTDVPIIGIEPALKPAVELNREGNIIIMATPMTLAESKFNNLMKKYGARSQIVPLPCPGLVELIENGELEGDEINNYLADKLSQFLSDKIAAIVLGCTHYPFIRTEISKIADGVPIIEGSLGTIKQLNRQLLSAGLINDSTEKGTIEIINSLEDYKIIDLSNKLLRL